MTRATMIFLKISGFLFLLLIWQLGSCLNLFESTLFPSPAKTFSSLVNLLVRRDLFNDITVTLLRMFLGFLAATVTGGIVGLIVGVNRYLYHSSEGLIDFFRSIPVVTLYPIFVLLFGFFDSTKIAMTFWATFWVIALNVAYGVKQSSEIRREVARVYKANKIQSFIWITFYEALPQTLVGLRIALSLALLVEVMCEIFMGANFGIGLKISEAFIMLHTPELFALVVVTGILGVLLNRAFVLVERKLIPWVGKI